MVSGNEDFEPQQHWDAQLQQEVKYSKVMSKHTRHFKYFSGVVPIGSGKLTFEEWVSLAQDMIDHDFNLKGIEKFYVLRNSLTIRMPSLLYQLLILVATHSFWSIQYR